MRLKGFWYSQVFLQGNKGYITINFTEANSKATIHVCSNQSNSSVPLDHCKLAPLRHLFTNTLSFKKFICVLGSCIRKGNWVLVDVKLLDFQYSSSGPARTK